MDFHTTIRKIQNTLQFLAHSNAVANDPKRLGPHGYETLISVLICTVLVISWHWSSVDGFGLANYKYGILGVDPESDGSYPVRLREP